MRFDGPQYVSKSWFNTLVTQRFFSGLVLTLVSFSSPQHSVLMVFINEIKKHYKPSKQKKHIIGRTYSFFNAIC